MRPASTVDLGFTLRQAGSRVRTLLTLGVMPDAPESSGPLPGAMTLFPGLVLGQSAPPGVQSSLSHTHCPRDNPDSTWYLVPAQHGSCLPPQPLFPNSAPRTVGSLHMPAYLSPPRLPLLSSLSSFLVLSVPSSEVVSSGEPSQGLWLSASSGFPRTGEAGLPSCLHRRRGKQSGNHWDRKPRPGPGTSSRERPGVGADSVPGSGRQ